MIDIPTRVKDALREGDRLKRYRFVVENMPQEIWTDVTDYQESTSAGKVTRTYSLSSGTYKFTAGEYALEVKYIESGSQIMVMVASNSSETITFDVNKTVSAIYRVGDDCLVQEQSFESLVITNDNLVSESVFFDERMCSDKEIKFGLCEGTSLEFQYFGLPNITGKRLQAFIDVQYKDADGELKWHEIPMGWFEVSESSRQASTGIIKVSAFNKLQSDYLDAKANDEVQALIARGEGGYANEISLFTLLNDMLEDYAINEVVYEDVKTYNVAPYEYVNLSGGFRLYDSDGALTNWWLFAGCVAGNIRINGEDGDYFSDEFYRMEFNASVLMGIAKNHYMQDAGYTLLNAIYHLPPQQDNPYEYITVRVGSSSMSLGDFIDANPNDVRSLAFGGLAIGFDKNMGASATPLPNNIRYKSEFLKKYVYSGSIGPDPQGSPIYDTGDVTGLYASYTDASASTLKPWYNLAGFDFLIPTMFVAYEYTGSGNAPNPFNDNPGLYSQAAARLRTALEDQDVNCQIYKRKVADIEKMLLVASDFDKGGDVTLRDLQSAVFEVDCQYGKLDRVTDMFSGVELNNTRLLPAEDLYPANDLYPNSIAERSNPAMYSKLWADEGNVRKFRYLIITYKGTETEGGQTREVEKTLQRTVNADGTDDYNMSDNWLFKNLVWTDEQVGDYADAMVAKMQDVTWFPFEMWCAGLPYVEAGDELEINVNGEAYTSYVLRRSLKGIQNLQDEMINGELDIF